MRRVTVLLLILIAQLCGCIVLLPAYGLQNTLSPLEFGLQKARSGVERYWALYNTHQKAILEGKTVDYTGIDTIFIEIPYNAKSIPLTEDNNYAGVKIAVKNKSKDFFLFGYENKHYPIKVSKEEIDRGVFKNNGVLSEGRYLLLVQDQKPWVENREGYNYGHIRKDILLIENGIAVNRPVMPYNNKFSAPECCYYPLLQDRLIFRNLTIYRTEDCTYKTFVCNVVGVDSLFIRDVSIITPNNQRENDRMISIQNCTNVIFDRLRIDGTYSRKDYSGYGVVMNNVWNFTAKNMYGHGNWGIFGNNNISKAIIIDSDINRFDIHCYGKDVCFKNVVFRNRYNQFSSVYGTIQFDSCSFINFVPVINGVSYHAYVGYNLVFNNCKYSTEHDTPLFLECGYIDDFFNNRHELSKRCLPNVTINNVTMEIPRIAPNIYLFFFLKKGGKARKIDYLSNVSINGLRIVYKEDGDRPPVNFFISNVELDVMKKIKETYENIDLLGNSKRKNEKKGKIVNKIQLDGEKMSDEDMSFMSNRKMIGLACGGMCGFIVLCMLYKLWTKKEIS